MVLLPVVIFVCLAIVSSRFRRADDIVPPNQALQLAGAPNAPDHNVRIKSGSFFFGVGLISYFVYTYQPEVRPSAKDKTPYTMLNVTIFSTPKEVSAAYDARMDELTAALALLDAPDCVLSRQVADTVRSFWTLLEPEQRCLYHKSTRIPDWYGVPRTCADQTAIEKMRKFWGHKKMWDWLSKYDYDTIDWVIGWTWAYERWIYEDCDKKKCPVCETKEYLVCDCSDGAKYKVLKSKPAPPTASPQGAIVEEKATYLRELLSASMDEEWLAFIEEAEQESSRVKPFPRKQLPASTKRKSPAVPEEENILDEEDVSEDEDTVKDKDVVGDEYTVECEGLEKRESPAIAKELTQTTTKNKNADRRPSSEDKANTKDTTTNSQTKPKQRSKTKAPQARGIPKPAYWLVSKVKSAFKSGTSGTKPQNPQASEPRPVARPVSSSPNEKAASPSTPERPYRNEPKFEFNYNFDKHGHAHDRPGPAPPSESRKESAVTPDSDESINEDKFLLEDESPIKDELLVGKNESPIESSVTPETDSKRKGKIEIEANITPGSSSLTESRPTPIRGPGTNPGRSGTKARHGPKASPARSQNKPAAPILSWIKSVFVPGSSLSENQAKISPAPGSSMSSSTNSQAKQQGKSCTKNIPPDGSSSSVKSRPESPEKNPAAGAPPSGNFRAKRQAEKKPAAGLSWSSKFQVQQQAKKPAAGPSSLGKPQEEPRAKKKPAAGSSSPSKHQEERLAEKKPTAGTSPERQADKKPVARTKKSAEEDMKPSTKERPAAGPFSEQQVEKKPTVGSSSSTKPQTKPQDGSKARHKHDSERNNRPKISSTVSDKTPILEEDAIYSAPSKWNLYEILPTILYSTYTASVASRDIVRDKVLSPAYETILIVLSNRYAASSTFKNILLNWILPDAHTATPSLLYVHYTSSLVVFHDVLVPMYEALLLHSHSTSESITASAPYRIIANNYFTHIHPYLASSFYAGWNFIFSYLSNTWAYIAIRLYSTPPRFISVLLTVYLLIMRRLTGFSIFVHPPTSLLILNLIFLVLLNLYIYYYFVLPTMVALTLLNLASIWWGTLGFMFEGKAGQAGQAGQAEQSEQAGQAEQAEQATDGDDDERPPVAAQPAHPWLENRVRDWVFDLGRHVLTWIVERTGRSFAFRIDMDRDLGAPIAEGYRRLKAGIAQLWKGLKVRPVDLAVQYEQTAFEWLRTQMYWLIGILRQLPFWVAAWVVYLGWCLLSPLYTVYRGLEWLAAQMLLAVGAWYSTEPLVALPVLLWPFLPYLWGAPLADSACGKSCGEHRREC